MLAIEKADDRRCGIGGARRIFQNRRNAVIEPDSVEQLCDGPVVVVRQTSAISALRPRESEVQPVGAAFQIVQCETIRRSGVIEIDAGHDRPATGRLAQGARPRSSGPRIERSKRETIIGSGDELVGGRALQGAVDRLSPLVIGRLWKNSGQGRVFYSHVVHSKSRLRSANFLHEASARVTSIVTLAGGRALFSAPKAVTKVDALTEWASAPHRPPG